MMDLNLFGGFSLTTETGRPVELDLAKSRALLCYLAIHTERRIDRGFLATLLWGSQPEDRARHSLTQALSTIVKALGTEADLLRRRRNDVQLQADKIDVDVLRLLRTEISSPTSDLVAAINLYEPGILGGLSLNEARFDEWSLSLRETALEHVLKLGMSYFSRDRFEQHGEDCVRISRKLLHADPYFEPAHRELIGQFTRQGDFGSARRQAETCSSILRDELGVEPSPETARVISDIFGSSRTATPTIRRDHTPSSIIEQPSIVVLALQNLTDDPALLHVCQGLSDDITTELSRYRSLFVIARESAFQFTGEPENIGSLCRRLGVRHALCGSLRPYQGQLRINVRLVEGASGQTKWSERYDADKSNILEISDHITENLVSRLVSSLEDDALARARRKSLIDWSAYDHLLQGLVYHHKSWYGTRMLFGAVKHFTKAVKLDPSLARAHAYLACSVSVPWYNDREKTSLDRSLKHANLAVEIDPFEAEAQRILGGIHLVHGKHDLARHHFDLAVREHPGNAHILAHAARYHAYAGNSKAAETLVNRARQLNPLHPAWYWQQLGVAKFGQGEYDQTVRMFGRLHYMGFFDRLYLAAAYAHLGDRMAAAHNLSIALKQKPELTRESVATFFPYRGDDDLRTVIEGLAFAGLK